MGAVHHLCAFGNLQGVGFAGAVEMVPFGEAFLYGFDGSIAFGKFQLGIASTGPLQRIGIQIKFVGAFGENDRSNVTSFHYQRPHGPHVADLIDNETAYFRNAGDVTDIFADRFATNFVSGILSVDGKSNGPGLDMEFPGGGFQ